jgi:hypothetical protein
VRVEDEGELPLASAAPRAFPSTLIGVHVNKLGEHRTWPRAGQNLIRMWDTRTTWSELWPTPEDQARFSAPGWRRLDDYLRYVQDNDAQVQVLFTLGTPPRWASDRADDKGCAYGVGTCGAPLSLDLWRAYVRELAQRYKGRIRYWELWNEPDYRFFYSSGQRMADLARVAKEELKAADPGNMLLSPGVTASGGLLWLHRFLEDGGGKYVDGFGFHWYFGAVPEQLRASIYDVRKVLESHGYGDRPLWNTEGGPACQAREHAGGECRMGDLAPAAVESVAARAILTMWLNGVEAFAYYTVEGAGDRTVPLLAPGWKASASAADRLRMFGLWVKGKRATAVALKPGVHAVRLDGGARPAFIVWTEGPDIAFDMPAGWAAATSQLLGEKQQALPTGTRALTATAVPLLLTGG